MAEAIRDGLRLEAIAADIAGDGDRALKLLSINAYDIAVLDRDIPWPSGDEIAKRIVAAGSGLPILMLTAADRLDDKASGFGLGADDYLTKPFELQELVLRLRALDRRRAHNRPPVREIAGLRLDPFRREVYRDGRYVALTRKQFAVLEVLIAAEGGVVSAEELLERAWDENADPFTNAVRIIVSALRKRLGEPSLLAPLTRIADATRMAASGSLSHRVRLPGRRDEFRELADAFDTMVERLEAHVAEQQRFAANASHELRTPLAITQTLLDVARKDPNRDNGELVDRLHAVNTRAIDLTEALLLLSRPDQPSFTREYVDLSLIAEEATETLLPLAEKRGLTVETSGDMTPTIGSHALLLQMTTNLLHNAIVHNLPEHGAVQVSTAVRPGCAVLGVENTGDHLTAQLVSTLTEPFRRGTGRIRGDD